MKRLLVILLILWSACEEEPPQVLYGEPFELAYGESALVGPDKIGVEFETVLEEGRCPSDVRCFWEGYAKIRFGLSGILKQKVPVEPIIYGYVAQENTVRHVPLDTLGYRITLMQLDPYPVHADGPANPNEYVACLKMIPYDLVSSTINLVDSETFELYLNAKSDPFDIDSAAVVGDTMLVRVAYSGGCAEHDFFLVGTWSSKEIGSLAVDAFILHNGHGDACEAFIREWRHFLLTPIKELMPGGKRVIIFLQDAPDSVLYQY